VSDPPRWEYGSEFHLPSLAQGRAEPAPPPWAASEGLPYASGRDALRGLLAHGRRVHGWRRLLTPDYFCQEVVQALVTTGLELRVYPDDPTRPFEPPPGLREGDVLLYVNFLGLRAARSSAVSCHVIEDHTHDPWSAAARRSEAAYCVASLRKTLPLPLGSTLWSPGGLPLPPPPPLTPVRQRAATFKLAAMSLKALYLEGLPLSKSAFRELALGGEEWIAEGPVSSAPRWVEELLAALPVGAWRLQRQRNHEALRGLVPVDRGLRVLRAEAADAVPLCVPLVFDSARVRDRVRRALLERAVYPTVLWPLERPVLEGVSERAVSLGQRILCLPCDWRYGPADLARVAEALAASLEAA